MPQAYQTRAGFVGNTMTRPASATGKRGGRRPKEYEEYVSDNSLSSDFIVSIKLPILRLDEGDLFSFVSVTKFHIAGSCDFERGRTG